MPSIDAEVLDWSGFNFLEALSIPSFPAVDTAVQNVSSNDFSDFFDTNLGSSSSSPYMPWADICTGDESDATLVTQWSESSSYQAVNDPRQDLATIEHGSSMPPWSSLTYPVEPGVETSTAQLITRCTSAVHSQSGLPDRDSPSKDIVLQIIPPAPRPFSCGQCSARFVGSRQLNDHQRNEHKKYRCCNKEYKHYKNFWQHRQAKHLGVRHSCEVQSCSYSASNKWNLKRHKASKHKQ